MQRSDGKVDVFAPKTLLPDVFDFLNYREFIIQRMAAMQANNPRLSQNSIARRAGFKSTQLLSMILHGKRGLSKDKILSLAVALKLDDRSPEYFGIIVAIGEAESHSEQVELLSKIRTSFQNGLFGPISDCRSEFLRHWYLPAIRELVSVQNFSENPEWISSMLGISAQEASDSILLLVENNFLKRTESGLERSEPSIHNFGKLSQISVTQYNMQMLEKSFQAVPKSKEERYLESLTFSMPKHLMPQLRESIKRFVREIDELVESHEVRDEVWQMNIQLFTLMATSPKSLNTLPARSRRESRIENDKKMG